MGETIITLAGTSKLEPTYHKMFDGILNSQAGQVITSVGLAAAVILALGLLGGLIFKALGRSNKLVTMFCPSIVRIVIIAVVCFVLSGPTFTIPGILKLFDWVSDAVGSNGKSYLGI